jgi:hypothetical protein
MHFICIIHFIYNVFNCVILNLMQCLTSESVRVDNYLVNPPIVLFPFCQCIVDIFMIVKVHTALQYTVDCVVMYQYYLHSDRFERSSILGVCMFKGHWRPDINELRGPSGSDPFTSKLGCGLPFWGKTPWPRG